MERPGTTACLEVAAEDVQFMLIHPDTSMLYTVDIDIDIDIIHVANIFTPCWQVSLLILVIIVGQNIGITLLLWQGHTWA